MTAKLCTTLPEASAQDALYIDAASSVMGEMIRDARPGETQLLLSKDIDGLARDRNIWPAANLVRAWGIAYHLIASEPTSIVLACADVAALHLDFPRLQAGEVLVGPTLFGFRLRELHDDSAEGATSP